MKYDDTNSNWIYSAGWILFQNPNPFNGTIHYTSNVGSYASFQFCGNQFILTYSGYSNRGLAGIYLDGIKIDTLNEYAPDFMWQSSYTSPVFPLGYHTVMVKFEGNGSYIDIDAIEILGNPFPFVDIPQEYQGNLHLFALLGQSNIVGINAPPVNQLISSTIFSFGNNYRWGFGVEPIDSSAGQVDLVSADLPPYNSLLGYSPAMSFALQMQRLRENYPIGLIPCAKGASSLYDWQKNMSEDSLYGSCIKRILSAKTMGNLSGIIFYQGETDAQATWSTQLYHDDWHIHFEMLINYIRQDVGDVPVVFVQIGNLPVDRFPYVQNVQLSQTLVNLPITSMVTSIGLPTVNDLVHLTVEGVQNLGVLLANAMNVLV